MNYTSIYIIKQSNAWIRRLHSASELILPGHRLATRIHRFQCFIRYVRFFILVFCQLLCPVFFWAFQSALMQMCYCVFVFMHARHFAFTLHLLRFPRKLAKQWFKRPKPVFIGWMCDRWNQSRHGVGIKRQQSFLFGSEGRNALTSSDEYKCCQNVMT